ncbi:SUKH-4 family immunity protein [Streptomyces tendae]|uniref:SUKH-4 family immunity protein n=1 Tax=Streptomyces tendae TaxID=1932 RepID=UPI003688ABA1
MLFDVTRGELVEVFGEDGTASIPATAFPPPAGDSAGARLLQRVGVPTGTLLLRQPDEDNGLLPLVREVVHIEDFENAPQDSGAWPVIGRLLNAHLALAPASGAVHAFDADEETVRELHTDVSCLIQVTLRFQRLLEEFTFGDGDCDRDCDCDEDADFERLEREVERIRQETSGVDPLPFQNDETVWSVVAEEIAAGRRFRGTGPGARSLHG